MTHSGEPPDRPEQLPPALTAEEWTAAYEPEEMASLGFEAVHSELVMAADHGKWHQAMAFANAALDRGDPRKLTSEHVQWLRGEAVLDLSAGQVEQSRRKMALASLIGALLPPQELASQQR